jgi:hypothetical protein
MNKELRMQAIRFGRFAVYMNISGVVFSGLVFPLLTLWLHPQPAWRDAALFAESFHPLQTATFFLGFFLVIGSLLTFVSLYFLSRAEKKIYALSGLIVNIVFTAVVFINYIIQTTYIPYLATHYPPETASILPAFTMANPGSFAWALEMYGWGGIGLSFILMAFTFDKNRSGTLLKTLFLINGCCSVASALITSFDMTWLFTSAGLSALVIWNLLVLIIDIFLLRWFALQQAHPETG